MQRTGSPSDPVLALLRRGLEHYGRNQLEDAIRCWREVLELDPEHSVARDYLESAGSSLDLPREAEIIDFGTRRAHYTTGQTPPPPSSARGESGVSRAQIEILLRDKRYEEALRLLYSARARNPDDAGLARSIRLLRERLTKTYAVRLGDLERVPSVDPVAEVEPLTSEERQVLALVDGISSYGDIVAASPIGRLPTLRILCAFSDARLFVEPAEASDPTAAPPPAPETRPPAPSAERDSSPPGQSSTRERVSDAEPDGYAELFRRATQAYLLRDVEQALALFGECVELRPNDTRAQHNLKALKRRMGS